MPTSCQHQMRSPPWAHPYLMAARQGQLLRADDILLKRPSREPVNRWQAAVLLARMMDAEIEPAQRYFTDTEDIPADAHKAAALFTELRMIG